MDVLLRLFSSESLVNMAAFLESVGLARPIIMRIVIDSGPEVSVHYVQESPRVLGKRRGGWEGARQQPPYPLLDH